MINEEFLKKKHDYEQYAIKSIEELIVLAKERDCDASKALICSFYNIVLNMKKFLMPKEEKNMFEIITSLQNGMFQVANMLNNSLEDYKVFKEQE